MKICVCIATYNQASYLEECIESVAQQTQMVDEIIVSNDCSTDNTKLILEQLATRIQNLTVIHQSVNLGMVANTNFCLRLAKADLIVKLDSDDILLPDYVSFLSTMLIKYPDAGYAHGAVDQINETSDVVKTRRLFRKTGFCSSDSALMASLNGYQVAANIIMFRKTALEAVGYITSNVQFGEDYYLSVEIADAGFGNVYHNSVLSRYRVWSDSGMVRQRRKLDEIRGLQTIFDIPLRNAFVRKGWSLTKLDIQKEQLACAQSDCMMNRIYSSKEKSELENEITKLSNTKKVRRYLYLYKNGFGQVIKGFGMSVQKAKELVKTVLALNNTSLR